jgi:hypothetical protein
MPDGDAQQQAINQQVTDAFTDAESGSASNGVQVAADDGFFPNVFNAIGEAKAYDALKTIMGVSLSGAFNSEAELADQAQMRSQGRDDLVGALQALAKDPDYQESTIKDATSVLERHNQGNEDVKLYTSMLTAVNAVLDPSINQAQAAYVLGLNLTAMGFQKDPALYSGFIAMLSTGEPEQVADRLSSLMALPDFARGYYAGAPNPLDAALAPAAGAVGYGLEVAGRVGVSALKGVGNIATQTIETAMKPTVPWKPISATVATDINEAFGAETNATGRLEVPATGAQEANISQLAQEAEAANVKLANEQALVGDQPYVAPTHNVSDPFKAHGITVDQVPQSIRNQLLSDLKASGGFADPKSEMNIIIGTGNTVPVPMQANQNTVLYKLIDSTGKYGTPSDTTVFWID